MAVLLRSFCLEPELQSIGFMLINLLIIFFIVIFVDTGSYTLFYLTIYMIGVVIISKRISIGRSYIPTKNLNKQTVIITGAAAGIGRLAAVVLAKLGAQVIVGIRGQERAERVAHELSKESNGHVIGYHLDLSNLASVKAFAGKINRVDILINNAGVVNQQKQLTHDGLPNVFGTNHIGHFYLTQLLLPLLIQSNGRVVNVSSIAHILAHQGIKYSDDDSFNPMKTYAVSKLANILHAFELQRRFGDRGIKAYSLNPGFISSTDLSRENNLIQTFILNRLISFASKTMAQGTMTTLFCSLSDEAQPGKYHSNCRVAQPSPIAYNSKAAQELWEESERILNEKTKSF